MGVAAVNERCSAASPTVLPATHRYRPYSSVVTAGRGTRRWHGWLSRSTGRRWPSGRCRWRPRWPPILVCPCTSCVCSMMTPCGRRCRPVSTRQRRTCDRRRRSQRHAEEDLGERAQALRNRNRRNGRNPHREPGGDVARSIRRDDLVVMTTHGRGGVRRWLLGSVTDKLILSRGRSGTARASNGARNLLHPAIGQAKYSGAPIMTGTPSLLIGRWRADCRRPDASPLSGEMGRRAATLRSLRPRRARDRGGLGTRGGLCRGTGRGRRLRGLRREAARTCAADRAAVGRDWMPEPGRLGRRHR